jgi:CCR4-NOT transcription complex subunit 2
VHYSVHPPPPGPAKALLFGEETLFLVFYENPRDALQEVAAQELSVLFYGLIHTLP